MKKIKAIILTIWFTLSIPIGAILCLIDNNLEVIGLLNMAIPLIFIISDEELLNMKLW